MKNLRLLREANGLSQQKLADYFGLSQSQIHGYETNAYEPDIGMLKRFSDFFETSVDYLIGHTDIRRKIEEVKELDLNSNEEELVKKYRMLSAEARQSIIMMIETIINK